MLEAVNPSGQKVLFSPEEHKYFFGERILDSVTRVCSTYFYFDKEKIAERTAKKYSLTTEEILSSWEKISNKALDKGKKAHKVAEDYLKYNLVSQDYKYFRPIIEACDFLKSQFKIIGVEKIVFSPSLNLAGTIDLLMYNKEIYFIVDWKTTETINDEAFDNAKPPLNHLKNSKLNKYSLQLNLYEYILKTENYIPKDKKVVKFLVKIENEDFQFIFLKDLQKEVELILNGNSRRK